MRLSYIDLPLYIGFRFSEKGSLIAGFSSGFLLSGKEYDIDGEFPPEDQVPFNTFDLEPLLGLPWGINEKLKADLRFSLSVLPVRDKPNNTNYYWQNAQFNNVITLSLYYQISR
jgi:hypothetical protein